MIDRKYLQVNLDTDTLPTSAVMHDVAGNTLAKLDLNLSSNLIGNIASGRLPHKVEFKVTKLSIPLADVPFTYVPFASLADTGVVSKAIYTVVPYVLDNTGQLVTKAGFNSTAFAFSDKLAPTNLYFPYDIDSPSVAAYKDDIAKTGEFPIHSIYELLNAINAAHRTMFSAAVPYGFSTMEFFIENDKIKIRAASRTENMGLGTLPMSHFYDKFEQVNTTVQPTNPQTTIFYPHLSTPADTTVVTGSDLNWQYYDAMRHPYCIAGNKYLRDLMPSLPWVRVDTRTVVLPYTWTDANEGDPYMYVLDTRKTTYSINKSTVPYDWSMLASGSISRMLRITNAAELILSFEDINPISFCGITSFVLMTNGLDATQQVFPVNITTAADASTQIPILEVYHPLWQNLSDQSDRVIVDKEQFTNQPLFTTNHYTSICDRNITFQLFNVRSGGKLSPLTIKPKARFCLQITFALYY